MFLPVVHAFAICGFVSVVGRSVRHGIDAVNAAFNERNYKLALCHLAAALIAPIKEASNEVEKVYRKVHNSIQGESLPVHVEDALSTMQTYSKQLEAYAKSSVNGVPQTATV